MVKAKEDTKEAIVLNLKAKSQIKFQVRSMTRLRWWHGNYIGSTYSFGQIGH